VSKVQTTVQRAKIDLLLSATTNHQNARQTTSEKTLNTSNVSGQKNGMHQARGRSSSSKGNASRPSQEPLSDRVDKMSETVQQAEKAKTGALTERKRSHQPITVSHTMQ